MSLDKEIIKNIETVAKKHGWTEEEIIDVKKACGITEEKNTLSDKIVPEEHDTNNYVVPEHLKPKDVEEFIKDVKGDIDLILKSDRDIEEDIKTIKEKIDERAGKRLI